MVRDQGKAEFLQVLLRTATVARRAALASGLLWPHSLSQEVQSDFSESSLERGQLGLENEWALA